MPTVLIRDLDRYQDLKGGEELIGLLLETAGYTQDVTWEARWSETAKCDNNSPTIQVRCAIDHAWAIKIVCKPRIGDAHFFHLNLYVPNALQEVLGKDINVILKKLQSAAVIADDTWRKTRGKPGKLAEKTNGTLRGGIGEGPPKPVVIAPPPPTEVHRPDDWGCSLHHIFHEDKSPNGDVLPGAVAKVKDRLVYILLVIREMENTRWTNREDWRQEFVSLCGWGDFGERSVSYVVNRLLEEDYIVKHHVQLHNKHVAYSLSTKGNCFVRGSVLASRCPTPVVLPNRLNVLLAAREQLRRMADAADRAAAIPLERQKLVEEIAERQKLLSALEAEETELNCLLQTDIFGLVENAVPSS